MSSLEPVYLERYADILVNFALNSGRGVRPGEVVFLQVPEAAKLLLIELNKAVLKANAHPLIQYLPNDLERDFFEFANPEQIRFFPRSFMKGRAIQADHTITIIAETNKHELEGIDPKKIMDRSRTRLPYINWLNKKEAAGRYTWTIAMYPTEAMAQEAGLTLEECWQQIVRACFLDQPDALRQWRSVFTKMTAIEKNLNNLSIDKLHVEAEGTDLWLAIGPHRRWVSGSGRNIPSFEIFTSPDARFTEGTISFDLPLYRYGHLIKDIKLEFAAGKIKKAQAVYGDKILQEMLAVKNANRVGEFSLTDKRFSRINRYMAETLYDENYGGNYGNTHLAVGMSFQECYRGKPPANPAVLKRLGFNHSAVHTDIIASTDRRVTAILADGSSKVIYHHGQFNF
ncbi:aminopeptidase [Patescibacteria group bacterium]|nr:aminopeptidase [Patescibacteria group bacterium]